MSSHRGYSVFSAIGDHDFGIDGAQTLRQDGEMV